MLQKLPTKLLRLSELRRLMSETLELRQAFSALHAQIRLSDTFQSGKSILITSSRPQEGKTTVATCLAITASLAGQRALLIDGDLRRPWIGSALGLANGLGLSNVLDGRAEPAEVVYDVNLFDDGPEAASLSVMSAGCKPASFLPAVDWSKARRVFQSMSEQFSVIILDTPPVLAANDALLLARIVDAVLLVIGAGRADRDEVLQTKQLLEPAGVPIVGAVLNSFDPKEHGKSSQPHGAYYSAHRLEV